MNKVDIAVLGYGTVGSGVVEVIQTNQDEINKRAGKEINVKYVLDLRDFPGDPVENILVHDYNVILQDPDVQIVVETMGGTGAAYTFVKQALMAGKSVATSNKALVAKHGAELFEIAREHHANYFYEASVGGGIPIIRPLYTCLTADVIDEISGILNGTTNYILSKMTFEGQDFDTVLKEAQELGYAERNPEADVEGHDAGRKIAILASIISGKQVDFEDLYTEGITQITQNDIAYAKKMGRSVKLIAKCKLEDGVMYAMVAPFMISARNPLYMVNDVLNAVFVHGNMLGDSMFFGSGAGKLPTASAVVSDVVDAAKQLGKNAGMDWSREKLTLGSTEDSVCKFFVRISRDNLEAAQKAFGNISIIDAGFGDEIGFTTDIFSEKEFKERAAQLTVISRIRLG